MKQRPFPRPVPIKTRLPVKAGLHEDESVLPLPLTPLTPRTEFDLRRSCKALLTNPVPSPYSAQAQPAPSSQHIPSNAAASLNRITTKIASPTSPDNGVKKASLLALTSKPHPVPPPLEPISPITYEFATTATARKFSVINLHASNTTFKSTSVTPSGATASPVLCRRPTVIDVSNRPKTADNRSRRQDKSPGLLGDREKLALFPRPSTSHQRPSTSHHRPSTSCNSKSAIDLTERPLPPLPGPIKPVQRSKSDSEAVLKKGSLGNLGRKIAGFFGRGKKQEAAAAA